MADVDIVLAVASHDFMNVITAPLAWPLKNAIEHQHWCYVRVGELLMRQGRFDI